MDVGLVCDGCSTFNPMGSTQCVRCNAPVSLDPASNGGFPATQPHTPPRAAFPQAPATAQHGAASRHCPECHAPVIEGHMFCGACGHHMDDMAPTPSLSPRESARQRAAAPAPAGGGRTTMFFGAMQAARAKLVLIKGDGLDGVSFTLAGDDHLAGRVDAPLLFDEDPFLSPIHANFFYRTGKLVVSDEGSVNGVYLRTRGVREIAFGDRFLVGEQLIEVVEVPSVEATSSPDSEGTYFFASPRRPGCVRLLQLLRGGDSGLAYHGDSDVVTLGREGNDINFPDDPFISGHHAEIRFANGKLLLTDLDSKNGTFLRVNKEQQLNHGDYVFMGQQLLRVEIV